VNILSIHLHFMVVSPRQRCTPARLVGVTQTAEYSDKYGQLKHPTTLSAGFRDKIESKSVYCFRRRILTF